MTSLKSLSLNGCRFQGVIPHQLGNLSNLVELDLQATPSRGYYLVYADSLQWLSGLPALEYLALSGVDLSTASDWLNMINAVPSLSELYLSNCQISGDFPLVHVNLSSLSVLDLRSNSFGPTSFPRWVSHLKRLTSLDLQDNNLRGPVPDELRNLTSLRALRLSWNRFNGSMPNGIGNLTSLMNLDLSFNYGLQLKGGIPASFKSFCKLTSLSLSYIKLKQSVSDVLQILEGCPSSTLELLSLNGCQLFGQLTDRIAKFKRLTRLILDNNSISGPLPMLFGELTYLQAVDISQNLMEGVVSEIHFANLKKLNDFRAAGNKIVFKAKPDWVPPKVLEILDMNCWQLGPGFPKWLQSIQDIVSLDMSNTGISESIPDWFWSMDSPYYYLNFSHNQIPGRLPSFVPSRSSDTISSDTMFDLSWNHLEGPLPVISSNLTALDLSNNFLSGNLFKFLCFNPTQVRDTEFLNLEGNFLYGEIPECWRTWGKLKVVRLGSNKLRGSIPSSIGTLTSLLSLRIQNNSLTGEIPLSLGNCTSIVSIDLGDNKLEGNIPKWIGERLSRLAILNLRGNKFMGYVPEKLCHLQLLQILNLSHNYLFGNLPECVANFSAMADLNHEDQGVIYLFFGGSKTFVENQVLVAQGRVKSYSTILNYLFGAIPPGMASLTFLNHLNLSYNNLSGRIPSSTQLQSFASSSFIGNKGLCGSPLNASCSRMNLVPGSGEGNGDYHLQWFSVSVMSGFAFGFWCTVGSIEVSERWRAFFGVLDRIGIKSQAL
ncbi:Receptor-like protein EIX2 [Linum grandiflorum]